MRERPAGRGGQSGFMPALCEPQWWFLDWLVGQSERSPMHRKAWRRNGRAIDHRSIGRDRILRIHVDPSHEPAWFVGPDRQHHEVERPKTRPDIGERRVQRSVSCEKDPCAVRLHDPAAPQRLVAVTKPACAEVLRGGAGGAEHWRLGRLPPIALDCLTNPERMQQLPQSKRAEPQRVRKTRGDAADRPRIEMVVVIVREHDKVEWRERLEVEARRHQAPWTDPLQRRSAFAPHRIGQDVHPPELQQCCRVADPRQGSIAGLGTW